MNTRTFRRAETPDLFDCEIRLELRVHHEDPLSRLDAVVDWNWFLLLGDAVRTSAEPKGSGRRPTLAQPCSLDDAGAPSA